MRPEYGKARDFIHWAAQQPHAANDQCVMWPFSVGNHRYGNVRFRGQSRTAHSAVLELRDGPAPAAGLHACHLPGSAPGIAHDPLCVNHVFWGSPATNASQSVADGTSPKGERHGMSKLSGVRVRKIRALAAEGLTQRVIAEQFGVSPVTVCNVVTHKTWRHIQ